MLQTDCFKKRHTKTQRKSVIQERTVTNSMAANSIYNTPSCFIPYKINIGSANHTTQIRYLFFIAW